MNDMNAWIESRENWTPAQNEKLDWVGGGDREKYIVGDNNGVTDLHNSYPRLTAALKVLLELEYL